MRNRIRCGASRMLALGSVLLLLAACGSSTPGVGGGAAQGKGSCPASGEELEIASFEGTAPTAAEGLSVQDFPEHLVEVPAGCDLLELKVRLQWDQEAEDLDLEVYDPAGNLAGDSKRFNLLDGAAVELVSIGNPAPGAYRAVVESYLNVETPYTLTAAITAPPSILPAVLDGVTAGPEPRVVVAVIDSGINVYHIFYHEGSPIYPEGSPPSSVTLDVLDEFGVGPECVMELTRSGDFEADFATDIARGEWAKASLCDVVWIKGTNVLARSFNAGELVILPDDEGDVHGVGTSAAVLKANPEAIVLFLEGIGTPAQEYAFTHPAVDFVSTSYGPIGSIPIPGNLAGSFDGTYRHGKLHFGACDNSPSTAIQDNTCGPWWSVGIAGFEERDDDYTTGEEQPASHGRQVTSGTFPDFVADFAQTLPYCMACQDGYRRFTPGTSFATPRAAGTASLVLLEARRALAHLRGPIVSNVDDPAAVPPLMAAGVNAAGEPVAITNWQLRRALEEGAWIPPLDDYDPVEGVQDRVALPVLPVAPWTLVAWGVLTPDRGDVIDATLAQLGVRGSAEPLKGDGFCEFQTGVIEARKYYWDFVDPGSETYMNPPQPDPFEFCD